MNKRKQILKVSAELFHKYGYNGVGLSSVIKEAKIPKGSFYYYFDSKEYLLLEVIQYFIDETIDLFNSFPKSIEGIKGFFSAYFGRYEELGFTRGCPIGNFALELADVNEKVKCRLNTWVQFLEKEITGILIEEGFKEDNAVSSSSFIVSAFEGVLLKAKIEKQRKAIDEFNYYIFNVILKNYY